MSKLFVGNLSFNVTDDDLAECFRGRGVRVESARVIRDLESGRSRGFGFVQLSREENMAQVIEETQGVKLQGRDIRVNEARPISATRPARAATAGEGRSREYETAEVGRRSWR